MQTFITTNRCILKGKYFVPVILKRNHQTPACGYAVHEQTKFTDGQAEQKSRENRRKTNSYRFAECERDNYLTTDSA